MEDESSSAVRVEACLFAALAGRLLEEIFHKLIMQLILSQNQSASLKNGGFLVPGRIKF